MTKDKTILGHIDCPTCGTAGGMRITHDKNGDPFGYCEAECAQQLRIGGDRWRVQKFIERHPWAAKPKADAPAEAPASAPAVRPAATEAPAPAPAPKKTEARSPMADALNFLGMKA